jgi:hypothetical protein
VAGTVKSQLDALLAAINAHINLASGAHAASATSYAGGGNWADGTTNPATTVEAQLDKVISDLASAGGADKVGATVASLWADATGVADAGQDGTRRNCQRPRRYLRRPQGRRGRHSGRSQCADRGEREEPVRRAA